MGEASASWQWRRRYAKSEMGTCEAAAGVEWVGPTLLVIGCAADATHTLVGPLQLHPAHVCATHAAELVATGGASEAREGEWDVRRDS